MRSLFLLTSLRAVPLYCPPRIRGCPARVGGETKVVSILLSSWVSTWSMLRSMILVSPGLLLPCKFWLLLARTLTLTLTLTTSCTVVAKGVKSATAPAERAGQGKWASKTSKEQQSVEVGRVGGLLAGGDGCECSACGPDWDSSRARLGGSRLSRTS